MMLERDRIFDNMVSTHYKLQQFYKECQEMTSERDQQLWDQAASEVLECEVKNYHFCMGRGCFHFETEMGECSIPQGSAKALRITQRRKDIKTSKFYLYGSKGVGKTSPLSKCGASIQEHLKSRMEELNNTILAADSKIGCWYEDTKGNRLLCIDTKDKTGQGQFVTKNGWFSFYASSSNRLTPLTDCNSWEWEPTPTYRPYSLQEIVERKDRVWVDKRLGELKLTSINLPYFTRETQYCFTNLQVDPNTSFIRTAESILETFTFDDGTPCGIEVE